MIDFMISRSYLLIQPYSLDFELFIQFKNNKIELILSLQSTLKWPVNRLVSKVYTELIFFLLKILILSILGPIIQCVFNRQLDLRILSEQFATVIDVNLT